MIIDVQFIQRVNERLGSLGYEVNGDDNYSINFLANKVFNRITVECNLVEVPNDLEYIVIDMVCGEFLYNKKQTGGLNDVFDLETAIKTIKTGDTDVTYALGDGSETCEERLYKLIYHLMTYGEKEFLCYRKIKW